MKYPSVLKLATFGVLAAGLAACSSIEAPTQKAELTESRIQQAIRDDADDAAPVYMKNARNKLKAARKAIEEGENLKADQLLDEALIAVEYATLKSDSDQLEKAAKEIQQNIDVLRGELNDNLPKAVAAE